MLPADLIRQGEHVLTVCNSCRYCEAYCPVFPAVEQRLVFTPGDLSYLANLCHNCGECLYACQYAPPHEFGINVPRVLAEIRLATYEEYCWPRPLSSALRRHAIVTPLVITAVLAGLMIACSGNLWTPGLGGDFYRVLSHGAMVLLFASVTLFVAVALTIGVVRFWRDVRTAASLPLSLNGAIAGLRDALTLKHLHSDDDGVDCTNAEEVRSPWRRWFHHCTMYGYLLCFGSTSVAAVYDACFGWRAPYGYTSLPVALGTVGGIGLLVGPAGLFMLKRGRDRALGDPAQREMDASFIFLLLLTSLTGILLLVLRERAVMGLLLVVHLASVLTLFVTMPYGKFVHAIYRTAALVNFALEKSRTEAADIESVRPAVTRQPSPVIVTVRTPRATAAPNSAGARLRREQPSPGEP